MSQQIRDQQTAEMAAQLPWLHVRSPFDRRYLRYRKGDSAARPLLQLRYPGVAIEA